MDSLGFRLGGQLFTAAFLIGMSKTGIQGISLLAVPLMAMTFGAKPSTGLILPILCAADLMAVLYYRRVAEWKYVFRLLPAALAGFVVALLAIYLLSVKIPKYSFVGTNAWFFLVINYLKIPVQLWAWNNITPQSLALDACTLPFVLLGGIFGILLVKRLPEKGFRRFTTAVTCVSVLMPIA